MAVPGLNKKEGREEVLNNKLSARIRGKSSMIVTDGSPSRCPSPCLAVAAGRPPSYSASVARFAFASGVVPVPDQESSPFAVAVVVAAAVAEG